MAVGIVDRQKLVNIADAVRAKKGITGNMTLDAIASNITSMPTADNNAKFDFARSGSKSSGDLLSYLNELDLSNFDTSNYTSMSGTFQYLNGIKSLDVSGLNTSKVNNMSSMFDSCKSLTSLDLSNFDTSNVDTMGFMFSNCQSLTSLDLSSFDTSKVSNMNFMFNSCESLTSLDLSNWDTIKATNMTYMFSGCRKLSNLTLGTDWASNSSLSSFDLSYCPLTHESAVDVINKLATRSNSPVIKFSADVGLYQSEIDVATNKGWSVSGCSLIVEDPSTATVGQYAVIDGVFSRCAYVADTVQSWGQRVFVSVSSFTDSNGNSTFQWGGRGTTTGITATDIGTGLTNTNALLAMNLQSTDGTPTIWDAITKFRNTHSDSWFVPSLREFNINPSTTAWSSSEYTDSLSQYKQTNGNTHVDYKDNKLGLNPAIYV